ncbi:MAG: helix-turn-helix domain-containing protein [Candidatus Paceibacterota bacterium]
MTNLILGIIIGAIITTFTLSAADRARDRVVGACKFVLGQNEDKEKNKQQILEFLAANDGQASNSEISEHLGVSSRTVVRYMDELEATREVTQVGETGRGVTYRLTR